MIYNLYTSWFKTTDAVFVYQRENSEKKKFN